MNRLYEDESRCIRLIETSDVLILGWTGLSKEAPAMQKIRERLAGKRPVIRVSERIYREGRWKMISPKGLMAKYDEHIKYRNDPVYMLCAGAYVSGDYKLIGAYPGKMFKWGYFPPYRKYDEEKLTKLLYKDGEQLRICFAARLIKLKHPELAVKAAEYLRDKNVDFHLDIVGDGPMFSAISGLIEEKGLTENISLRGFMKPDEVRDIMEKSHVFLFASNYLEGWGAVVNEAMNSASAVIASSEAGAVPYLIRDGENGLTFSSCDEKELRKKIDTILIPAGKGDNLKAAVDRDISEASASGDTSETLVNGEMLRGLQVSAYKTIAGEWNAQAAAQRLLTFCEKLVNKENYDPPKSGPMSIADVIKAPGIIRTLQEDNHLE
ncbi:glycosyltransferase family 4 protein [Butyrivibrio sp. JL13D10]|uniref:glycosyltransferase family 4 protein n=1 Tax=Butyrivibrio sp. JL13D10 TaxID=3236815 RepID=UPI0038B5193F